MSSKTAARTTTTSTTKPTSRQETDIEVPSYRAIRTPGGILFVAAVLWWGGRRIAPMILPAVRAVHGLGPIGPVLFILLYIVAVVAMIPGSWFTLAGGAVFGIVPAVTYGLVG